MSRISSIHRSVFGLALSMTTLALAGTSVAQSPENYSNTPPGPFHQPVPTYPVELGFSQHHASTAAEGYLRGKAAVIQALGNFHLSESQAEILRQQARWLDRENDLKQTEALHAQRKMWEEARLKARNDRNARHAAGLELAAQRQATVYTRAYKLSPSELDMKTGVISWPAILQSEYFAPQRAQIEQLFQQHLSYGEPQADAAREIARSIDRWSATLRRASNAIPRDEYMASQKFLMGLKYSAASVARNVAKAQPVVPQAVPGATLANK